MKRLNLATAGIVAFTLLMAMESSLAQYERSRRSVPANTETQIYNFWNCRNDVIQAVNGEAERGRITTRETTQHRCGNRTQRVLQVIYMPPAGYKGPDDVYLYSGSSQSRIYLNIK
ncbi:hypothetical protein [Bosea sp. LjRoot237]|uniref:hypothetical protein n=1 Tax=Bosea sp. LjRoot237 TaxID=3342292 RepID=UPI003ECFA7A7